jgi:hypothetical protein
MFIYSADLELFRWKKVLGGGLFDGSGLGEFEQSQRIHGSKQAASTMF